ncbi:MAG: glycoside hydrolase family 2 protein, partial [Bacillota bacterium]
DLEEENLLTVCCESRVEWDLPAKKTPMGVLNDWDCKPYPNGARGALPDEYTWTQPLGLWAPVSLLGVGEAVLEQIQYAPEINADGSATVHVRARVTSLVDRPAAGRLEVGIGTGQIAAATLLLRPHASTTAELAIRVEEPALWWPWTHGDQPLYTGTARLYIEQNLSATTVTRFGIRTVEYRGEEAPEGPGWFINGRPIFPMGSNYICDFRFDTATYERHRSDLQMMKDANMNMVRVHAHVEPDSFYRAADELGMLVMCDGVLNGCYVFGAPPEDRLYYAWAARDQVEKLVPFLWNHPSIAVWVMHNEPPWPKHCWWFGDPHRTRTDRDVDLVVTLRACELDPTRPVITASGEKDEHTYGGWYHDTWMHYRQVAPRFPTEFGAQALPSLTSPFWAHVSREWPVDPADPTWVYRDYQAYQWASFGVGAPGHFGSLAEYVAASQAYQAWVCRYAADRFRKQKWRPTAGIVHFMFVDAHPAITWSVVDYHRLPKQAYQALRDAFRPTHVIIDPAGEFQSDRLGRLIYRPGREVAVELCLVNDDPRAFGPATLTWEVAGQSETMQVEIPADTAPATCLTTLRWTPPAEYAGELKIRTSLQQAGRLLEEQALAVLIRPESEDPAEPERAGPTLRLMDAAITGGALRFALQNPYHPIAWKDVLSLSLNGEALPVDHLQVEQAGRMQSVGQRTIHFVTATPVWFELRAPITGAEQVLMIEARVAGYGPVTFALTVSLSATGEE